MLRVAQPQAQAGLVIARFYILYEDSSSATVPGKVDALQVLASIGAALPNIDVKFMAHGHQPHTTSHCQYETLSH
jgi:hypothetical protein